MPDAKFVFDTTRYSTDNALAFARASQIAYQDEAVIRSKTEEWGFDRFRYFDLGGQRLWDTQAFAAGNDKMIIVVFRGTQPKVLGDWVTDALAIPVPGPAGLVHDGFNRALDTIWKDVTDTIASFQDKAQSIWFAGHSLGAALATLAAAYRVIAHDRTINGIYTYGSPRVGDRDFSRVYDQELASRTFRFVNNNDLVARVPMRSRLFSHVGSLRYFDTDGVLYSDPHWWNRFLDEIKGTYEDIRTHQFGWIGDHQMERYIVRLEKSAVPKDLVTGA